MLGLDSIRDTIPFPKTSAGISLMDNAPDNVSESTAEGVGNKEVDSVEVQQRILSGFRGFYFP